MCVCSQLTPQDLLSWRQSHRQLQGTRGRRARSLVLLGGQACLTQEARMAQGFSVTPTWWCGNMAVSSLTLGIISLGGLEVALQGAWTG